MRLAALPWASEADPTSVTVALSGVTLEVAALPADLASAAENAANKVDC